jgi:thioredoxin-related protein
MFKPMLMRLSLLALCLFAFSARAEPPEKYPFVSYDQGLRLAKQQNKPIFLYMGRLGCGWCDKTNKETFSNENLRKLYTENYVLVYADTESGKRLKLPSGERITEMDLASRFKIFATPVFIYLDADGKEIMKIPGYKTVNDFLDYDRYVRGGYYKTQTLLQFLSGKS